MKKTLILITILTMAVITGCASNGDIDVLKAQTTAIETSVLSLNQTIQSTNTAISLATQSAEKAKERAELSETVQRCINRRITDTINGL